MFGESVTEIPMLRTGTRYSHDWITLARGESRTTFFEVLQICRDGYVVLYDNNDADPRRRHLPGRRGGVNFGSQRDLEAEEIK